MIRQWKVTASEQHMRIDQFAYSHYISRKCLKDIKMKGDILVDGIHQTVRYQLKENEIVSFLFPPENHHIQPEDIPLKIVYEDDDLLVIDKPSFIPCIPTRAHPQHTLANAIMFYYQQKNHQATVHFVNRLDKETSGLMIVAKSRYIHELMNQQLYHIHRIYRAHVQGYVEQGLIDFPIYKDGYQMKRIIDDKGQKAITHYQCLSHNQSLSYVRFQLTTGRTHQIRVHMASIGHPLVGDPLYGDGIGTFDLESYQLVFRHPITHQMKYIEKKDPR